MAVDFPAVIRDESQRVLDALAADPDGTVSWCGDWRVSDVAAHIAGGHLMAAKIIEGRPTTDLSVRNTIQPPDEIGELADWTTACTAALLEQIDATTPDTPCWTWSEDRTVGFWTRRRAHEGLIHRWDAERGAGIEVDPMDPTVAADGIDEMLDVFVAIARVLSEAPGAGESAHLHCTDTEGEWLITFPAPTERVLLREHAKGDVAFRGTAEALLLFCWNRDGGPVEVLGDQSVADRWQELVPPL